MSIQRVGAMAAAFGERTPPDLTKGWPWVGERSRPAFLAVPESPEPVECIVDKDGIAEQQGAQRAVVVQCRAWAPRDRKGPR